SSRPDAIFGAPKIAGLTWRRRRASRRSSFGRREELKADLGCEKMGPVNRMLAITAFTLLALASCLAGCSSPCGDNSISHNSSPNGKLAATVFIRDCGSVARSATWVTIHAPSQRYDKTADMVFTAEHEQNVRVEWQDDSHLLVECFTCREGDLGFQAK